MSNGAEELAMSPSMPEEMRKQFRASRATSMAYIDSKGNEHYRQNSSDENQARAMDEWEEMVKAAKAGIPYEEYKQQQAERQEQEAREEARVPLDEDSDASGPIDPKSISALKQTLAKQQEKAKALANEVQKHRSESVVFDVPSIKAADPDVSDNPDSAKDARIREMEAQLEEMQQKNMVFQMLFKDIIKKGGGDEDDRDNPDAEKFTTRGFALPSREFRLARDMMGEEAKTDPHKEMIAYAKAAVAKDEFQRAVELPPHMVEDETTEWLAVNTINFFKTISALWFSVSGRCTKQTCQTMTAGEKVQYLWQDAYNHRYKRPTKVPATLYVDLLFTWVQRLLNDDEVFVKQGEPYPEGFRSKVVNTILRRLFRVFGHIYHHHFYDVQDQGQDRVNVLNDSFKHFIFFLKHWDLMADAEMVPLKELIEIMYEKKLPHEEYENALLTITSKMTLPRKSANEVFAAAKHGRGNSESAISSTAFSSDEDEPAEERDNQADPVQAVLEQAEKITEAALVEDLQRIAKEKEERQILLEEENQRLQAQLQLMKAPVGRDRAETTEWAGAGNLFPSVPHVNGNASDVADANAKEKAAENPHQTRICGFPVDVESCAIM